ncbi:MAG TPA: hypoxanthine phosphoribosyltransferase [Anaerolineae bacterium]|nr:hypoxanthine phosphoribosyltransferase [Anaerolineae bacterium]
MVQLHDDVGEILISEEEIRARTRELGRQISQDYQGRDLLLVCVLKGAITFLADLMREITVPHAIDVMAISSYGASTRSSGVVRILKDLDTNINGCNVLIVEDIIDTGRTLSYITANLKTRHPKSLRICTLLDKPSRREIDIPLDYVGFEIPNKFVIGYGLDYGEIYRNLPYIGVLKEEKYAAT